MSREVKDYMRFVLKDQIVTGDIGLLCTEVDFMMLIV